MGVRLGLKQDQRGSGSSTVRDGNARSAYGPVRGPQEACGKDDGDSREPVGIRGIVLAGVHAWNRDVLESVVARPLLPVAGRPLIWHVLRWLRSGGVMQASICGNSDTTVLLRRLGGGADWDMTLEYYEDIMPRGPAGCARDASEGCHASAFVVVEGTILPQVDLHTLLEAHTRSSAALTMVIGGAEPRNGHGAMDGPPVGIYVFSPGVLEEVPAVGYQDIKETLIPCLYNRGELVATFAADGHAPPRVTDATSYLALNMWALEEILTRDLSLPGYARVNGAWIHTSARVDSAARFVGDVLVGPGCVIDHGAVIIGPTTVGAGCMVGEQAVISRSAIWDRCRVGAAAHLDQCILTDDSCLEPGAAIRNTVRVAPLGSPPTFVGRLRSRLRGWRKEARVTVEVDRPHGPPGGQAVRRPTLSTEAHHPPAVWARQYRRPVSSPLEGEI
jgi:NDP-sugar pyrophosphorylase family protein